MDFNGDMAPDLDPTRIHYVSMSLGSIFAGVFLGINDEVTTATMSSPAGPWTSILTDPEAVVFGQPLRDGLAAQGLIQGTLAFDELYGLGHDESIRYPDRIEAVTGEEVQRVVEKYLDLNRYVLATLRPGTNSGSSSE